MTRWIVTLLWAMSTLTLDAGAQGVRGMIKKKVSDATGKTDQQKKPDKAANPYTEDVLELTEPVMKGFMNGIRRERALMQEFADEIAAYKKPEEYGRCTAQVATSEEGMKAMKHIMDLPEGASANDQQRAIAKMNEEMKALIKKQCGPDVREEWPRTKLQERVAAIHAKAAAATGRASTAGSPPEAFRGAFPGLPASDDVPEWRAPQSAAGMTLKQYDISWERAENYCRLLEAGAIHPKQPVVHMADNGKSFWIYSETEARVIEPLCPEIKETRARINILLAHAYLEDLRMGGR